MFYRRVTLRFMLVCAAGNLYARLDAYIIVCIRIAHINFYPLAPQVYAISIPWYANIWLGARISQYPATSKPETLPS